MRALVYFLVAVTLGLGPALVAEPRGEVVLSVEDLPWQMGLKRTALRVWREGSGVSAAYRLQWERADADGKAEAISEEYYYWLRGKVFDLVLAQEARFPTLPSPCEPAMVIELKELRQSGKVCAGDHRGYAEARALLAEVMGR